MVVERRSTTKALRDALGEGISIPATDIDLLGWLIAQVPAPPI
jgi:hypothetical protein